MNIQERFKLFKTYLESISGSHQSYVKPLTNMAKYVLEAETGEELDTYYATQSTVSTMLRLQQFVNHLVEYLSKPEHDNELSLELKDEAERICDNIDILSNHLDELDEEQDAESIKAFDIGNAFDIIKQFPTLESKRREINKAITNLAKANMLLPADENLEAKKAEIKSQLRPLREELRRLDELEKPYSDIKSKLTVLANKILALQDKYRMAAYAGRLIRDNQANASAKEAQSSAKNDSDASAAQNANATATAPMSEEEKRQKEEKDREAEAARLYDEAHPEEVAARKAQADMDALQATLQKRRQSDIDEKIGRQADEERDIANTPSRKALYQIRDQINQLADENGGAPINIESLTPSYGAFVSSLQTLATSRDDIRTGLDLEELTRAVTNEFDNVIKSLNELVFPTDRRDDIKLINCDNVLQTLSALALTDDAMSELTQERLRLKQMIDSGAENARELGNQRKVCENIQNADSAIEVIENICNNINKLKVSIGKMAPIARKKDVNDSRTLDSIDPQQIIPEVQNRFAQLREMTRNDAATIRTMYLAIQAAKKAKSTDLAAHLPEGFNQTSFKTGSNGGYLYTIGDIEIPIRIAYEMSQPEGNGVASSVQNDNQLVVMEQYKVKGADGNEFTTSKWNAVVSVDADSIGVVASFAGTFKKSDSHAIRIKMTSDLDFVFVAMFKLLSSIIPPVK
jgi:hypothetical protein